MLDLPSEAALIAELAGWAEAKPSVRAMVLTSTRARPGGPVDALSDYDVMLFVTDVEATKRDELTLPTQGKPMVEWGDQNDLYGVTFYFRGVVYRNGTKVDFTICPEELLELIAAQPTLPDRLDVGYRVLLDRDGRTAGWRPATYRAHIPAPPTKEEYESLVEELWWSVTYVAKALWRGEVVFAKFVLDRDIKLDVLRRFLEWRIELDHDWSLKPGAYGRGLERLLPADMWAELAGTYVGTDIEDNWDALFGTAALFRRVALEVADALGFSYPQDVDDAVTGLLASVRSLPRERFDTLRT